MNARFESRLSDAIKRQLPSLAPSTRMRVKRIIRERWEKAERQQRRQPVQMELLDPVQIDGGAA